MLPHAAELDAALRCTLAPDHLEVIDETASHAGHAGAMQDGLAVTHGTHFRIRIWSSRFEALARVAQHRLVYDSLQPFIARGVHALAIEIIRP
jgi:BolA family transcriptional regulator, general stress-responsive regulator